MNIDRVLLVLFVCVCSNIFAQEKCGSMDLLSNWLNEQPAHSLKQFKTDLYKNLSNTSAFKSEEVLTISCVVHVVYRRTSENIPDDQIYDAFNVLNEDFNLKNNLENVFEEFKDKAANAEIEFCLANIDPQGNPTTGVNRVSTEITDFADNYSENKIKYTDKGGVDAWPTSEYLNIWVGNISNNGLLGYAQFPNGGNRETDGIVVDDRSFGRARSDDIIRDDGTTSHEVGHWLGLFHIWGDDCSEDDNGVTTCSCDGSDNINDTNNSKGPANGCKVESRSCGTSDMIQNFMDYSNCSSFFTAGQVDVMRSFFEPGGYRRSLVTSSKCADLLNDDIAITELVFPAGGEIVCTEKFRPVVKFANNGSDTLKQATFKITINDNKKFLFNWEGEMLFADYATIEMDEIDGNIGGQKITVTVESVNGNTDDNAGNSKVENDFQVKIYKGAKLPFEDDFEIDFVGNPFNPEKWSVEEDGNAATFFTSNKTSHFGTQCLQLSNFSVNEAGLESELISTFLNIASFTEPKLKFYHASATKKETGDDQFLVLFTTDCGVHFDTLFNSRGLELATASKTDEAFIPVSSNWRKTIIDLEPFKDEAFANIHFKFISGLGNNFYLDDINIFGKTPVEVGIEDNSILKEILLYPNPANQYLNVCLPEELQTEQLQLLLYNTAGQQVTKAAQYQNNSIHKLDINVLNPGIYYLKITSVNKITLLKKIIKI